MWCLNPMGYTPHGQANSSIGKNLSLYSQIGAWLIITLVALAQRQLDWPKYWSHGPPLIVDGSRGFESSSRNSRKFFPFRSDAWKVIFHIVEIGSHSCFLQKSHDDLLGRMGENSNLPVSLSTEECSGHFCLLGQSEKLMWL